MVTSLKLRISNPSLCAKKSQNNLENQVSYIIIMYSLLKLVYSTLLKLILALVTFWAEMPSLWDIAILFNFEMGPEN